MAAREAQTGGTALYTSSVGEGEELVLLHGWGMHSGIWTPLLDRLSARYRVTMIDLPGYGYSPWQGSGTVDELCEQLLQVVPARATWIGWSLGGMVAQWLATVHPGRVDRVVALASTPRFVQAQGWPHAMAPAVLQQFAASLAQDYRKTLQRFLALQTRGADHAQETLRIVRAALGQRPEPQLQALEAGLDILAGVDLRERLTEIRCPLMWLLGENDALVPVEVAGQLRDMVPAAQVQVVAGAGHAPFLSHPERFVQLLDEFMHADS